MRSLRTDGSLDNHAMAERIIGDGETRGLGCLGFHPFCWIEGSRVIGVQSQWCLPYHPGRTIQMVLDIQDEAGGIEKKLT